MFAFTDEERAGRREGRSITTDAQGREVLAGLTLEETAEYMTHVRKVASGDRDREGRKRYLELHDKHEIARLQALRAEIDLRNDKPTRH